MRLVLSLGLVFVFFLSAYGQKINDVDPKGFERYRSPFDYSVEISPQLNREYFHGFFIDARNITVSPKYWKGKDWAKVGVFGTVALGFFKFDAEISRWSQRNRNGFSDASSLVVDQFGNTLYPMPVAVGLYSVGQLTDNHKLSRLGLVMAENFVFVSTATLAAKLLVGRSRPQDSDISNMYYGPHFFGNNMSFWSGHSANAWSMATMFAMEFKNRKWIPVVAYSLASMVSLSRINDQEHWAL